MKYIETESDFRPDNVDAKSSPNVVLLRRNIREVEENDSDSGAKRTVFRYDEAAISKDEYIQILSDYEKDLENAILELAEIVGGE